MECPYSKLEIERALLIVLNRMTTFSNETKDQIRQIIRKLIDDQSTIDVTVTDLKSVGFSNLESWSIVIMNMGDNDLEDRYITMRLKDVEEET
jgi:hypothetical protein